MKCPVHIIIHPTKNLLTFTCPVMYLLAQTDSNKSRHAARQKGMVIIMKRLFRMLDNIVYSIKFVSSFNKVYIILSLGISLLSIVAPITEIWGPKQIVDLLAANAPFYHIIQLVAVISALEITKMVLFALYQRIYLPIAQSRLKNRINMELFEKSAGLPMEYFETSAFYDQYTRALFEANNRFIEIIDALSMLLSTIIYLFTLGSILVSLDAVMLAIIIVAVAALFVLRLVQSKISYRYNMKITPIDRKMAYIRKVFYEIGYAKEVRTLNLQDFWLGKYLKLEGGKNTLLAQKGIRNFVVECVMGMTRILLLITLIMIYLAVKIKAGALSVGSFLALFIAATQATNQLIEFIGSMTNFYEHSTYIENFRKVMELKTEKSAPPKLGTDTFGGQESIRFDDVEFCYPGTESKAINHLTTHIGKGERVALVGPNGAGKSTLSKLMLGLYQPTSGRIHFGDLEMNEQNVSAIRDKVGVMFQDFMIYALSIAENILLHEIGGQQDEAAVIDALKKVGLYDKVCGLKNGIHTVLSKEFDENGTVFSGGELQKIALARMFAKDKDVIIMDEPSSALDPISENEFFEYIMNVTQGKTVLYITHRLSVIKLATRIIYLEDGEIFEDGTFDELMNMNGRFARMYKLQSEKYII